MKKFFVLIVLALLAVAGTGYAQTNNAPVPQAQEISQVMFYLPLPSDISALGRKVLTENNFGEASDRARYYEDVQPCRLFDSRLTPPGYLLDSMQARSNELRVIDVSDSVPCWGRVPDGAAEVVVRAWVYGLSPSPSADAGWFYFTTAASRQQGGVLGPFQGGYMLAPFGYSRTAKWDSYGGIVALKQTADGFFGTKSVLEIYSFGTSIAVVDLIGYTTNKRPQ